MKQEPVEINEFIGSIVRQAITPSRHGVRATVGKIRSALGASREKRLAGARQAMAIDRERMRAKGMLGKGSGLGIGNIIGHAGSQASAAISGYVAPKAGVRAAAQSAKQSMRRTREQNPEQFRRYVLSRDKTGRRFDRDPSIVKKRALKDKIRGNLSDLRGARGQDRPMGLKPFADKERQSKMTTAIKKAAELDRGGKVQIKPGGALVTGRPASAATAPATSAGDFGGRGRASASLYRAAKRKKREAGRAKAKEMATGTYRTPAGAAVSTDESFAPLETVRSRLSESETTNNTANEPRYFKGTVDDDGNVIKTPLDQAKEYVRKLKARNLSADQVKSPAYTEAIQMMKANKVPPFDKPGEVKDPILNPKYPQKVELDTIRDRNRARQDKANQMARDTEADFMKQSGNQYKPEGGIINTSLLNTSNRFGQGHQSGVSATERLRRETARTTMSAAARASARERRSRGGMSALDRLLKPAFDPSTLPRM